jgi:hypothetical protein
VSTPEDMAACERRNCWGNPPMAAGRDNNNASGASVLMVDSTRLLPLVMLACFLSGGALIGTIMVAWLLPPRIVAEVRAHNLQEVADARAEARAAGTDAAIWKNRVVKLEARLDERR